MVNKEKETEFSNQYNAIYLIILCCIIAIISISIIIIYFIKTWSPSFSNDSKVWAEFGNFISPLVSLITMIILIITIQKSEHRAEKRLHFDERSIEENRANEEVRQRDLLALEEKKIVLEKIENLAVEINSFFKKYSIIFMNVIDEQNIRNKMDKEIDDQTDEYIRLSNELEKIMKNIDEQDSLDNFLMVQTLIRLYFQNIFGIKILYNLQYLTILKVSRGNLTFSNDYISALFNCKHICSILIEKLQNSGKIENQKYENHEETKKTVYYQLNGLFKIKLEELSPI